MTRYLFAASTFLLFSTGSVLAQGYGAFAPGFGPGGYLQGKASVINASGDLYLQAEQARQQREVAEQAKLDTKKQAFDLRLYEKAFTETFGDNAARDKALFLKRVMKSPQEAEITNGIAQNTMLPYLNNLALEGIPGPPIKLQKADMKLINVTVGTGGDNIGILKDGGHLKWPLALRGPTQKKLDKILPQAVSEAANDELDIATYNAVDRGVKQLSQELRTKFREEEIDGGLYLDSRRMLDSLESAVKALRQPTASQLLKGDFAAMGSTVPELVANMSQKGLKFAPATPGKAAPYYALYNAMVSYGNGSMNSQAFASEAAAINLHQSYLEKSKKFQ